LIEALNELPKDHPQIEFEWDEEKAKMNLARHGINFEEAQLVFSDPNHITESDDRFT
jgi:uncharacterized DUF497 family protein